MPRWPGRSRPRRRRRRRRQPPTRWTRAAARDHQAVLRRLPQRSREDRGGVSFDGLTADEHRPSTPTCSRRPCARCAAASCRRPMRRQPDAAAASTRWWRGSRQSLDRAAGQAHVRDRRRPAPAQSQGIHERGARSARRRLRRRGGAAGGRHAPRASTTSPTALQVSPSFIEQYVIAARARGGQGDGPGRRAARRLDVPRRVPGRS